MCNFRVNTLTGLLFYMMILILLVLPTTSTLYAQVTEDNIPPTIVHLPIKTAVQGQAIPVIAKVADDSQVDKVTVNYKKGEQFLDIPLPMQKTAETGVMKIKVTSEAAYIYGGPGTWNDTLATVIQNEAFDTFEQSDEHGFYHIKLSDEVDGWISFADAQQVMSGAVYSGIIPPDATLAPIVKYHISAEDIQKNKVSTISYTIHIVKPDQQDKDKQNQDQAQNQQPEQQPPTEQATGTGSSTGGGSILKSPWVWGGLAVVGAGAVVAITQSGKEDEKKQTSTTTGTIRVTGGW